MLTKYKKLWFLLNSKEKKYFFLLILLCFFSSCLDLIGVISILPFLTVLTQPSIVNENAILGKERSFNIAVEYFATNF